MGRVGPNTYGMSLGTSFRQDVKAFFLAALGESGILYDKVTDLMAKKGVLVRTPYIKYAHQDNFIKEDNFMSGYLSIPKRSLLSIEITHLATLLKANVVGKSLLIGFAQVTKDVEVRRFCQKGIKLANDIISTLSKILLEENISVPQTWDASVTSSIKQPFSDKLMMTIISSLNSISIGNFGMGIGASMRNDIAAEYFAFMVKIGKYAQSGAKIAIKNGWIERPPQSVDHKRLQEEWSAGTGSLDHF
jgi:hypothetical protein